MLGHRELELEDYLRILRRRIWLIVIPGLVGVLIVYLISLKIPNRYTSIAKVLVEDPQVSTDFVRPVLTQQLDRRLSAMQEQVFSRSRLQPILQRLGLYRDDKRPIEDLVSELRKNLSVGLLAREAGGRVNINGFSVSFTTDRPEMAQRVCAEIVSLFLEENLRAREQTAQGTAEFLDRQLQEAKRRLDEQDSQMAQFKAKYLGQLPGREEVNLNLLMTLNSQLDGVNQALYRIQQDKAYAESLLAEQLTNWQASQKGTSNPQTLEQRIAALQDQLLVAEARYRPEHPDVIKLKHDIQQLKRKIEEAESAPADQSSGSQAKGRSSEPAQIRQLRNQIRQYDLAIREKTHNQQRLQSQIGIYQGRLHLSPAVEEQYKLLTRDYQIALQSYNDLLGKKTQTQIATDLERRQQGEQFRLVDPPSYPAKPSYPNRLKFALGGLGGGLALGAGLALMLELLDKSLRTDRDVEFYLQLPALALVPRVAEEGRTATRDRGHFWEHLWEHLWKPAFLRKQSARPN